MFLRYVLKWCTTEQFMYHIDDDGKYVMVLLYVDDILCATKNETFKKQMIEN